MPERSGDAKRKIEVRDNRPLRLSRTRTALADAGKRVIVAGLEAQSNSARQTTAAANILGLRTVLILRQDRDWQWQGNPLIDRILGAEVRLVETDDPAVMDRLREALEEALVRPA